MSAALWLPWCVLAPIILSRIRGLRLAAKWHYHDGLWLFIGLIASCLTYSLVSTSLIRMLGDIVAAMPPPPLTYHEQFRMGRSFVTDLLRQMMIACPVYVGIAGLGCLSLARERIVERERQALEEAAELSRAKVEMLYAQLRPHFLFNALNTMASQLYTSPESVERSITALGALLRQTLESDTRSLITLRRELDLVEQYFWIEQARFGDDLKLHFDLPDDCVDALVPALILQPLVENAVRHGLGPKKGHGQVTITVEHLARQGRLSITVHDDGVGLQSDFHEGIGLSNTKARLRVLYGEHAQAAAVPHGKRGTMSVVELPWRMHML